MQSPRVTVRAEFGAAVRRARRRAHWSQRKLARRAGLSLTYVGEVERGQRSPSLLTVSRIAKAAGMTAAQFLKEAGL